MLKTRADQQINNLNKKWNSENEKVLNEIEKDTKEYESFVNQILKVNILYYKSLRV